MNANGLREKPRQTGRIIAAVAAALVAAGIFAVSSIPASGLPSHPEFLNVLAHFCEYMLLGSLLTIALNSPTRALWKTALLALVIASLYGASDELHQLLIPGRVCDFWDWLTDSAGALLGIVATIWFLAARRVSKSRQRDQLTIKEA